ncbi:MAG: peptidoglycan editing factor PgeF [Gammaproteobacteria bacterium]|nr:peptidoglycan editing factor PgeF [Gammaproteobacteria bacterium]
MNNPVFIRPDWSAPDNIRACVTTRAGGVSCDEFSSFNLAMHVEDQPQHVQRNRQILAEQLHLPAEPLWLEQVHGTQVVDASRAQSPVQADASFTVENNVVCSVMTADCLPLLICNRQGTKIAAAHAGWRGLQAGIIEATVDALQVSAKDLLVWLGPAIGPAAFEVGDEVRAAFVADMADASGAFTASKPGHWLADIYQLARLRLRRKDITAVFGGDFCTYNDPQFYSYRRQAKTGRMASLIWRET